MSRAFRLRGSSVVAFINDGSHTVSHLSLCRGCDRPPVQELAQLAKFTVEMTTGITAGARAAWLALACRCRRLVVWCSKRAETQREQTNMYAIFICADPGDDRETERRTR